MRIRHNTICELSGPVIFSTLSKKDTIFEKYNWKLKMYCDSLYKFLWNIYHSKKNWARYDKKMCIGVYVKYPLFLYDSN